MCLRRLAWGWRDTWRVRLPWIEVGACGRRGIAGVCLVIPWDGKVKRLTTHNTGKHTDTKRQHLPDAAAVLCLQGKLWQAHTDTNKAIECYAESLKLNPFMWDAFLGLCDLGKSFVGWEALNWY